MKVGILLSVFQRSSRARIFLKFHFLGIWEILFRKSNVIEKSIFKGQPIERQHNKIDESEGKSILYY